MTTLSKLELLSQMLDNEAARIESLKRTVKELEHEIENDDSLKTLQTQVDELSAEWREVMDKKKRRHLTRSIWSGSHFC